MPETKKRRSSSPLRGKLAQVRAVKIAERKVLTSKSNAELAKEFGTSPAVVSKALTLAAKADIVVRFEDKLYTELVPDAHEAVKAGLDGSGDVARAKLGLQLLQSTQVLRPQASRTAAAQAEDDALALYILSKRKQAALEAATIEAEYGDTTNYAGEGARNLLPGPGSSAPEPARPAENRQTGSQAPQIEATEDSDDGF